MPAGLRHQDTILICYPHHLEAAVGRHTLTLDEDNERFLDDEQRKTGKPFKGVVNDLLREVRQRRLGDRKRKPPGRYAVRPLSVGLYPSQGGERVGSPGAGRRRGVRDSREGVLRL